jgi:hypothetical protein
MAKRKLSTFDRLHADQLNRKQRKQLLSLKRKAAQMGMQLVPAS